MSASQESSVNSHTRPRTFSLIYEILKDSFECLSFVLIKTTLYVASLWLPIAIVCILILYQFGFSTLDDSFVEYIRLILGWAISLIAYCFLIFIVPYYVFVFHNQKNRKTTVGFWDFISENIFPLVVNHIKATVQIWLFLLLLIIPGIIKALQLALVTQVTFFEEDYKNNKISALKSSKQISKGYLWIILLLILIPILIGLGISFVIIRDLNTIAPKMLIDIIQVISKFYINCIALILMTQAYFVFKKYQQ